jgi:hypothetical protein
MVLCGSACLQRMDTQGPKTSEVLKTTEAQNELQIRAGSGRVSVRFPVPCQDPHKLSTPPSLTLNAMSALRER